MIRLSTLPAACAALSPWRRALAALAAGGLCSLTLPPLSLFPLLWVGFPALLLLLHGAANRRQAFLTGWCFAFGYFTLSLYWIAAALFVDVQRFWWLVPFCVAGLPALLGVYYGLAALLWHRWRGLNVRGAALLALLLFAAEYARGHLFSGFPWNLFGYVWTDILPVAQSASLFGVYGLTLLTLLAACLPVALFTRTKAALSANLLACSALLLLAVWGGLRLQEPSAVTTAQRFRIVQPNIAQAMKWDPTQREAHLQTLLRLSAPAVSAPTLIIWPESAVTFFLTDDASRRSQIAAALPNDAVLVTGGDRRQPNYAAGRWDYFNSLLILDGDRVSTVYDKFHLVPFGEYVPLQSFGPVATATAGMGSFKAGSAPQTLQVRGFPPFSPLICYEVIFPGAVTDKTGRAQLLINITNDAWYGRSAGPHQHLAIARMRAIEEGLPLLRAANTGISAQIDAYGRIVGALPLDTEGVLDAPLPRPAPRTIYTQSGDAITLGTIFVLMITLCFFYRRARSN